MRMEYIQIVCAKADITTMCQMCASIVQLTQTVHKFFSNYFRLLSLLLFHALLITLFFVFSGVYPNCECTDKGHVFSSYINDCYIACEGGSTGIGKHPKCDCGSGMFYKKDEFQCKTNIGRECPPVSIGIGPDCLCIEKDKKFYESHWSCNSKDVSWAFAPSVRCPDRSQKYPQCSGIDPNALKSLVG